MGLEAKLHGSKGAFFNGGVLHVVGKCLEEAAESFRAKAVLT